MYYYGMHVYTYEVTRGKQPAPQLKAQQPPERSPTLRLIIIETRAETVEGRFNRFGSFGCGIDSLKQSFFLHVRVALIKKAEPKPLFDLQRFLLESQLL